MSDLISVIIPIYKVEPYLCRCLDSILNQDYSPLEVILVNDCSPDGSGFICEEYCRKYNNFSLINNTVNMGLAESRNIGFSHSSGKYITFIDSDDYVDQNYVSDLYSLLVSFSADIACSTIRREYENQTKPPLNPSKPYLLEKTTAIKDIYYNNSISWSGCGKLFRRDVLSQALFKPVRKYEDFYSMSGFVSVSSRIVVDNSMDNYHYICRNGSILTSFSEDSLSIFEMNREISSMVEPDQRELLLAELDRKALVQLLNLCELSKQQYKSIFQDHKKELKRQLWNYIRSDMPYAHKATYILLCSTPAIYRFFFLINKKFKRK